MIGASEASADGLTYTFELRESVTWHDGMPFTGDDVKFTFDYFAPLELPFTTVGQPQNVAEVTVDGPSTVQITLERAAVTFPVIVAGAVPIVPRHVWEGIEDPLVVEDPSCWSAPGPTSSIRIRRPRAPTPTTPTTTTSWVSPSSSGSNSRRWVTS